MRSDRFVLDGVLSFIFLHGGRLLSVGLTNGSFGVCWSVSV